MCLTVNESVRYARRAVAVSLGPRATCRRGRGGIVYAPVIADNDTADQKVALLS